MTTRRMRQVLRAAAYTGMIVAVVLCGQQQMATADAGPVQVCVTMSGGNDQVTGLQMELTWDGRCMSAQHGQGTAAQCAANSTTGKSVMTSFPPNTKDLIRAVFVSMSDQSPIPDGQLFCCSFTLVSAQANPCCSVSIPQDALILANPRGRLYVSDLPDISVEPQVENVSCEASVPGGSADNPVRPPIPAAAIVQPPVVSAPAAPAAPAPGALAPLMPRPNVPAEAPPVQGLTAEAPTPALAPTEPAPSPVVTPAAARTSTAARTPTARTPTAPAATPQERTPQVQGTPTGPVRSVTAPAPSASQPATTPTPKRKEQGHKKRRHASQG